MPEPVLRVVRGEPSAEEVAALVTVLAVRAAGEPAATRLAPRSPWVDRTRALRRPWPHGPGAWRASALPR